MHAGKKATCRLRRYGARSYVCVILSLGRFSYCRTNFQKDTFGHPCAMTSDFCESNFRYKFLELHVQNNLYHLDFLTRLIK